MRAFQYTFLGLAISAFTASYFVYRSLDAIEVSMQKDVLEWNKELPEGYHFKLTNNINLMGSNGVLTLVQDINNKPVELTSINFKADFTILGLLLPNGKFDIKGNGLVHMANIEDTETKYVLDTNGSDILSFSGIVDKKGNFNLDFTSPSQKLGIVNKDDDSYVIFFDVSATKGKLTKDNQKISINSNIEHVEILDSPEYKDGISFDDVKTEVSFEKNKESNNTIFVTQFSKVKDLSEAKLFDITGFSTSLKYFENKDIFKHSLKVNIENVSSIFGQDSGYLLDYDISVPFQSKSNLISLLRTYQSLDILERQEQALNLYKSGFNLHINNFKISDAQDNGNIKFNLNLNPQKDILELPSRVSFDGSIEGRGRIVDMLVNSIPFNAENLIKVSPDNQHSFTFNFKDGQLTLNNDKAEPEYLDSLVKSLMGLDVLMVEAEEELRLEKEQIALDEKELDSPENVLSEIPGTEEDEDSEVTLEELPEIEGTN